MPEEINEEEEAASNLSPELEVKMLHALNLLESEVRRLEKLEKVRETDLTRHEKGLGHKIYGDLIKQHLKDVKRGMPEATLDGYDESGEPVMVTVPLEVKLGAKENMERHYKLFQKSVKGVTKAGMKLGETRDGLVKLRGFAEELAAASELEDEAALEETLKSTLLRDLEKLAKKQAQKRGKKNVKPAPKGPFDDLPASIRPRVFESLEGWTILCGRGARANDWLTTRIANGNDWFFHIASFPGAHIILRNQKGQNPPLETMLDCAQLCLYYSKMKNAQSAGVHYVQCKYVRKPKGAKPGMVLVHGGKNLSVRREDDRLKRLLGRDML